MDLNLYTVTMINKYNDNKIISLNISEQINKCESLPCAHGECTDHVDGYICDCNPGYQGTHCDGRANIN